MEEYVINRFNKFAEIYDFDLRTECGLKRMLSLEYILVNFNDYCVNMDNYINDFCKLSQEISRINADLYLEEKTID